jgi:hypothetical protein
MTRFAALAALALVACTSVKFIPTNPSPRKLSARPVEEVAVFTTAKPERPYVEVGIVTAQTSTNGYGAPLVGVASLITSLREKAAEQGCDGVVMGSGSTLAHQGTCIVYR